MLLCHAMLRTGVRSITSEERLNIWKRALFRSPMSDLVVKELASSLRDDFLLFFDSVAFADNPDWSDCYCSAYHFANKGKTEGRRFKVILVGLSHPEASRAPDSH